MEYNACGGAASPPTIRALSYVYAAKDREQVMLRNYLTVALRNLTRRRVYSLINIVALDRPDDRAVHGTCDPV